MRIVHVIDSLGRGGAERMLVDLANAAAGDGHDVAVCLTRTGGPLVAELARGIEVLVLDRTSRVAIRASWRLARWLRARRPDVLHVHMRSSLQYVLALRAFARVRAPIVFHDHYGRIEIDAHVPAWFRIGQRWIARYVGVHDQLRDWARAAGMSDERAVTIPNAIDLERIRRAVPFDLRGELHLPADARIAVVVASFKSEKGIDIAIRAMRELVGSGWHLVIIGGGVESEYGRACTALVRDLGLERVVHIIGGRDDVPALLRSSDAGVLTSHSESGPLVLLEYLAAGLPIVATRVGNIGHRLAALDVPAFVAPSDSSAVAFCLAELAALSSAGRAERVARGHAALAEWRFASTMQRWYEVYSAACAASR